ncbi:YybH family protein [Nocardia sp. NPDC101769]|uniref:YybH family protein n=1 Tax=Nocardia sp. NPDC101769 TaxID=3364333 RepID=UPI003815ED82
MPGTEDILRTLLDEWKAGIDAHDPGRAAAVFTEDAIFQGLHPHSTDRQGVYDYYNSQPVGLTVKYHFHETRRLSDNIALAYLRTDFTRPDGVALPLNLGLLATRNTDGQWLITFYQVSAVVE